MKDEKIEKLKEELLREWHGEAAGAFCELIAARNPEKGELWPTEVFFKKLDRYFLSVIDKVLLEYNWRPIEEK